MISAFFRVIRIELRIRVRSTKEESNRLVPLSYERERYIEEDGRRKRLKI